MHRRRSSLRWWVRRSPAVFWIVAVLLAALTGTVVSRLVQRADAEAARYGSVTPVVVARRDIPAGTRLDTGDVVRQLMPTAFAPSGALRALPIGRAVAVPLFRGQVVVASQLAPHGLSTAAALVPPGRRAIALPTGGLAPPLRRGDVVDVIATFDDGGNPPTFAVAERVPVVAVNADDDTVTVAVEAGDVDRVAYAATGGTVTIVLTNYRNVDNNSA